MSRLAAILTAALVLGPLPARTAAAQQNSGNLVTGSVTVRLKRVNTITGGAAANPLYGTFAPGDSRLFLVQQGTTDTNPDTPGRIRYINPSIVDSPVGTLLDFDASLPGALDATHFEKGLLGVAFHPDFNNPAKPGYLKFYTFTSELRTYHAAQTGSPTGAPDFIHPEINTPSGTLVNNLAVLREWTANSPAPTGVAGPSRILMKLADPQNQHNGGTIAFSPVDGYLYWALGDGGGNSSNSPDSVGGLSNATDGHTNSAGPGAPHGNGQDRTNPFGDMLRINPLRESDFDDPSAAPSANGQYQIPLDNPFTMAANINPATSQPYPDWNPAWVDEIYAYGLRNPYRFSFDRGAGPDDPRRGELYLADAGYNDREEVDVITAGGNYGWVIREGTQSMVGEQGIPAYTAPVNAHTGQPDALLDPIAEYDQSVGNATIGGFVYRGAAETSLAGKYLFGDYQSPLRNNNGLLMVFDTNETKAPNAPNTISRLAISPLGAALPNSLLLGFGQDATGLVYAMFDNGQIYSLNPVFTADFDDDGDVDAADLIVWQSSVAASSAGDADGDGDTDGADFIRWQLQDGTLALNAATIAMPEPASVLILCWVAATMAYARRHT